MKRSEQCDQLYTALALARANFGKAERTKEAKIKGKSKMSGESFEYTYKYAPLEECFKAIDQALSDQGLALVGGVEYSADGQLWVITHLGHTSGQWIENALSCGIPQDSKDMGGMITYARRYGVTLTVQMQAEDDDDGPRGGDAYQDRRQARKPTPKPMRTPETAANGAGVSEGKSPAMTVQEVVSLAELAEAAGLDHSKFGDDMRLLLELSPGAKLTRAFLAQHLTREQYDNRWQRYTELIEEMAADVPIHAEPDTPESTETHESSVGDGTPEGEASSVIVDDTSVVDDPIPSGEGEGSDDIPQVEVDEDGFVTQPYVTLLVNHADAYGQKGLLRQIKGNDPGWVVEKFRYAWVQVQVAAKKGAKV